MPDRTDKQIANRRRFLATVAGTTIAVAGCSGGQNTDTPANSSPDSTTEELPDPDGSRNTGEVNGIERAYTIPNTVPIGIDGDRVITRANVDGGPAFVGFNYLTGERLWTRSIESYDTPAISASGQIGHGRLYNIGSEGDEDKYINVIDATSGELLNNIEFESASDTRVFMLNDGVFVFSGGPLKYITFYVGRETGMREPAFDLSEYMNTRQVNPLTDGERIHPLAGNGMFVSKYEFRYGQMEPETELSYTRADTRPPYRASNEQAIFGIRPSDSQPARAISREDGSVLWERSDNFYVPPFGYGGDTLAYLGADEGERVIGVEPSNGDIRWERTDLDLPTGDFGAVMTPYTVTDRALVVGTSNGVKLFSLADGATVARSEDSVFSSFLATQSRVLTTDTVTTEQGETNGMIVYKY
jgi:outer membrane protein assembly factor BamB